MCGIFAALGIHSECELAACREMSHRMDHRGPDEHDWRVVQLSPNQLGCGQGGLVVFCHERLSIIDLHTGKQPIRGCDEGCFVVHNGEIYNHERIRPVLVDEGHTLTTTCDSEVIVHLLEDIPLPLDEEGEDPIGHMCNQLDGVFGFAAVDKRGLFVAARDPIGVKPLYYGRSSQGVVYFASEMKAIIDKCDAELMAFPPGHYYTPRKGFVRYYTPLWFQYNLCTHQPDLSLLRQALISATEKRLMSDVPLGVLLSGGLDSSLIAAITARAIHQISPKHKLKSFSIGLDPNAPDLVFARKAAQFLDTEHHEVHFTVEEGLGILDKLVWHLESYDVTSVRASTPMYFLSQYITRLGVKVVLSGEGSDEIFGGYLYFHNAPDDAEFQKETIDRVQRLSTADCLRADKSTMAHGLEVRVPFLDKGFLEVAMSMAPQYKRAQQHQGRLIEKYILRKAFDEPQCPWLPTEILWRQKEQFSDGVGYNWIDQMMLHCSAQVSDEQMRLASERFPHNTPDTKEAYFIRQLFHKHFPGNMAAETVKKWIPKWQTNKDPSGRASAFHECKKTETDKHRPADAHVNRTSGEL